MLKIETFAVLNGTEDEIRITADVSWARGEYGWADSYEITSITDDLGNEYELEELDDHAEERIIDAYAEECREDLDR